MKYLLPLLVLLTGCCDDDKKALSITNTNNPEYQVHYLFEKDGCKIYGFYDAGYPHYFNSCGGTMSTRIIHQGKTTTHVEENI